MSNLIQYNGLGDFNSYKAIEFPDRSLKVYLKPEFISSNIKFTDSIIIQISLKSNNDIIALGLLCQTIKQTFGSNIQIHCRITYMMYQQDDRLFADSESFGLKFICNILNSYPINSFRIFHPHSDKVEFLDNCTIIPNTSFIKAVLKLIPNYSYWIIPDSGAAKTQLKQIEILAPNIDFVIASKTRDHSTGKLIQYINKENFEGRPCVIFDDICLAGGTFLGLFDILKEKNAGDIYLAVSHGVFNEGIEHLTSKFKKIFTTNSITTQPPSDYISIFDLKSIWI